MKFLVEFVKEMRTDIILEAPSREAAEKWVEIQKGSADDWLYPGDYDIETYINDSRTPKDAEATADEDGNEIY